MSDNPEEVQPEDIDADGGNIDWPGTAQRLQERVTELEAAANYPREEGENIVLGPGIFSSKDRSVLNWDGVNYVPQKSVPEILPLKDYKVRDNVEVLVIGDWYPGVVTEVNKGHHYLNVHTDRKGPVTIGSVHAIRKV